MTSPTAHHPGYLVPLKTVLTQAVKRVFDDEFHDVDFRGLHCSIEFPAEPANYPGIWVDYEDTDQLQIAGIGHREYTDPDVDGLVYEVTRWRFSGIATYTVVALSSLERDRLYDHMVSLIAFGHERTSTSEFREYIENSNPYLALNFDWDQIRPGGNAAGQGTPWQTDDVVYERSIAMEVIGEFVSDGATSALVPLSEVRIVEAREDLVTDPTPHTQEEGWV